MVVINRVIAGYENRCVSLDNRQGTYLATEMLIRYGHKHIAYIGSNHSILDETERKEGYLACFKRSSLSYCRTSHCALILQILKAVKRQ